MVELHVLSRSLCTSSADVQHLSIQANSICCCLPINTPGYHQMYNTPWLVALQVKPNWNRLDIDPSVKDSSDRVTWVFDLFTFVASPPVRSYFIMLPSSTFWSELTVCDFWIQLSRFFESYDYNFQWVGQTSLGGLLILLVSSRSSRMFV